MNRLTLAVAGGGKTQSIIDACLDDGGLGPERTLAITYTLTGQRELATRLRRAFSPAPPPAVTGWFAFLQGHFIRPYLPRLYKGERLRGFSFEGDPGLYAKDKARHLDREGRAYRRHLARLAYLVMEAAGGAPVDRLERWYTRIYIDEVQDLVGWDLEILDRLLSSKVHIQLVGDVRQSLIETNPQDAKNKQYRGVNMLDWFREREGSTLEIRHETETHRCSPEVADFADRIFCQTHGFRKTISRQMVTSGHDGVFAVDPEQVAQYVEAYRPQCLRYSSSSSRNLDLKFRNFGEVKGLTFDRVLIVPTKTIEKFVLRGEDLASRSACGFYVGVTRARYSVALVLPATTTKAAGLPLWQP